ncbi:MAG: helix-turn-helix domain-containing protein [bacterium]
MIRWNVDVIRAHMERHGWENANQLAIGARLTAPVAARVLAGGPLERIEVATLEHLAEAFRVKPWTLLEYAKDSARR